VGPNRGVSPGLGRGVSPGLGRGVSPGLALAAGSGIGSGMVGSAQFKVSSVSLSPDAPLLAYRGVY
jgi:hypothetical protein